MLAIRQIIEDPQDVIPIPPDNVTAVLKLFL